MGAGMGRDEELAYAAEHGIPVKQKKDSPYSYDENMWSNTAEGGGDTHTHRQTNTHKDTGARARV